MTIQEAALNWLVRLGVLEEKGVGGLDFMMGAGAQTWHPKTDFNTLAAEGYEYNAIIYGCITALMESMKEAPILVEVQNRKGEWEEKPDHPLARLLARPNPDMTEDDFQAVSCLLYTSPSPRDRS